MAIKAEGIVLGLALVSLLGVGLWIITRKPSTPPESRIAPPDGRCDVSMDGWVDQSDIELVKAIISGAHIPTNEEFRRADVNGDELINTYDLTSISNYIRTGELPPI